MGVLKSVEPTGFLAFAPAFAGTNWADVDRRIIQNCPHGRGRVLSSPARLFGSGFAGLGFRTSGVLQVKAITAHVAQNQSGRSSASDARNASRRSSAGPRRWEVCVMRASRPPHGRLADSSPNLHVTNH
jgi:hypothetical protein